MRDDREQNGRFQNKAEKTVKEAMQGWTMEPPAQLKQKSLQSAMSGIKEARMNAIKQKRVSSMKNWMKGFIGVGAAAVLVALIVLSTDFMPGDGQSSEAIPPAGNNEEVADNGNSNDNSPENNSQDNATDNGNNDTGENELDQNEGEETGYPHSGRDETKDITTHPEGMEETNTYHLLDDPALPFSTYIRDMFTFELSSDDRGHGVSVFQKEHDYISVDIFFFNEGTSAEDAVAMAEERLTGDVREMDLTGGDLENWAIAGYTSVGERHSEMLVGNAEGYTFYVHSSYAPEAGDGWYPVREVLLSEWIWKESGQPLFEN